MQKMLEQHHVQNKLYHNVKGYTLVELLVVVVIMVVLAVISVTIFLNQKSKANDSVTKTDVATISDFISTGLYNATSLTGGDGTNIGDITSSEGTITKNGSIVYIDTTLAQYCVSKVSPTSKIFAQTQNISQPYETSTSCISATTAPPAVTNGGNSTPAIIPTGTVDPTFTPPAFNGAIYSVLSESDGKTLVGGVFTNSGYPYITRLNSDGTLDASFTPPSLNGVVSTIVKLSSGKYLISGGFSSTGYTYISRLNANGTRDTSFTPPTLNGTINGMTVQNDGKIMIGGNFDGFSNGVCYGGVMRLNATGTFDPSFVKTGCGMNGWGAEVTQLSNGKYLVTGSFFNNGYWNIEMLNANGSIDTSFTPPALNSATYRAIVQSNGKIAVIGFFSNSGYAYIVRLNSDGTRDTSFTPSAINDRAYSFLQLSDGKYLVTGSMTGTGTRRSIRLNADGTHDSTYVAPLPATSRDMNASAITSEGKYLLGGQTYTGGQILRVQ